MSFYFLTFCIIIFYSIITPTNIYSQDNNFELQPFKLKELSPHEAGEKSVDNFLIINTRDNIKWDKGFKQSLIIGMKGGGQYSTFVLSGLTLTSNGILTYPLIGLFAEYRLHEYISVELDLFYSQKGTTITGSFSGKAKITYLSVVPYLKVNPFKKYFFVGVGPSIHYKLSDSLTVTSAGQAPSSPFAKSSTFGIVLGLGTSFDIDPIVLSLEGRFDLGLTNLLRNTNTSSEKIYYRDIQALLSIGYKIF